MSTSPKAEAIAPNKGNSLERHNINFCEKLDSNSKLEIVMSLHAHSPERKNRNRE